MGLPSPKEAAKTHGSPGPGFRCLVCQNAKAVKWLEEYLAEREAGGVTISHEVIAALFRKHLGMSLKSASSIGRHLRLHTDGRWDRIRG